MAALTGELVTKTDLTVRLHLLEQRLTIKVGSMSAVVVVGGLAALF